MVATAPVAAAAIAGRRGRGGIVIEIPADLVAVETLVPIVGGAAIIEVPADLVSFAEAAPFVPQGITITVPADEAELADFHPRQSSGATVGVPADIVTADTLAAAARAGAAAHPPAVMIEAVDHAARASVAAFAHIPADTAEVEEAEPPLVNWGMTLFLPADVVRVQDVYPGFGGPVEILVERQEVIRRGGPVAGGPVASIRREDVERFVPIVSFRDFAPLVAGGASVFVPLDTVDIVDVVPELILRPRRPSFQHIPS